MPMVFDSIRKLGKSEKPKHTQAEVITKCATALSSIASPNEKAADKAKSQVAKCLKDLKYWLFHSPTTDDSYNPTREDVIALAEKVLRTDLLRMLARQIDQLEFEARKDAAQVFGAVVRIKDQQDACPGAEYVREHPDILNKLIDGYNNVEVALNCGSMFRDCIRDETLARVVLEGPHLPHFFELVEVANFEIASDAFSSFKDLLSRHKAVVAQYLSDNYTEFFDKYQALLESSNYVTRRQSLKLLGELLLDKSNLKQMLRYVSSVKNLCTMMNLLRDSSRSIQYEAFHVFKVFVANPNKPQPIVDILTNNREKLLKYLEDFHTDRDEDELFKEEKAQIIKEISILKREVQQPGATGPTGTQQQQQQEPSEAPSIEPPLPEQTGPTDSVPSFAALEHS